MDETLMQGLQLKLNSDCTLQAVSVEQQPINKVSSTLEVSSMDEAVRVRN